VVRVSVSYPDRHKVKVSDMMGPGKLNIAPYLSTINQCKYFASVEFGSSVCVPLKFDVQIEPELSADKLIHKLTAPVDV